MAAGVATHSMRHAREIRPPPVHRTRLDLWIVGELVDDSLHTASNSSSRSCTYRYSDIERTPSRDDTARIVAAPMPSSSISSSVTVTIRSSDRPRPGRLRRPRAPCARITGT